MDINSTCATLREYRALPPTKRWPHRASRHPLVTQFLLPPMMILLVRRLPFDAFAPSWCRERLSVHLTNAAILSMLGALALVFGLRHVLLVQMPITVLASVVGSSLFSLQHCFEEAQWARQECWDPMRASLEGAPTWSCPRCCNGPPATSATTTSTACPRACPTTGCGSAARRAPNWERRPR